MTARIKVAKGKLITKSYIRLSKNSKRSGKCIKNANYNKGHKGLLKIKISTKTDQCAKADFKEKNLFF